MVTATNDSTGEVIRSQRVAPSWKLTSKSAAEVVAGRVG
jgi:hypothetical protein